MTIVKSIIVFLTAGLCEIGGGYLIWLWIKENKPLWFGITGGLLLALYGIVAALQPASFGRVYATYGGFFIALSLLWAWKVDGFKPDRYDFIGAIVTLIGVSIIYFIPRD
jgi:small multidrug resistance family-3 protein